MISTSCFRYIYSETLISLLIVFIGHSIFCGQWIIDKGVIGVKSIHCSICFRYNLLGIIMITFWVINCTLM